MRSMTICLAFILVYVIVALPNKKWSRHSNYLINDKSRESNRNDSNDEKFSNRNNRESDHKIVRNSLSSRSYSVEHLLFHGGATVPVKKVSMWSNIMSWLQSFFTSKKKKSSVKAKGSQREDIIKQHVQRKYSAGDSTGRIQKELKEFASNPPDGCKITVGKNIRTWIVTLTGAEGTIYAGESYKLKFTFPKEYPAKPPSVFFLKPTPKHEHVYSNGDICLNLLGRDWRPTMTAQMLAVSILSMLSSAKEKTIPQDNALHADSPPGQQQDNWMYHDDRC